MKLTREDLAMMLDEMNNNHADCIEVDVCCASDYVDFDIYNGGKYIKTVLTLE